MTQISRYQLKPKVWEKIFDIFTDTFMKTKDRKKLDNFIDNFFSPTEKIMLAKRLAIAVLLAKGNDYDSIKNTLRVTAGTISKVNYLMKGKNNGLNIAVMEILKRDAGKMFFEEIMGVFDYPRIGSNWSMLRKQKSERQNRIHNLKTSLG